MIRLTEVGPRDGLQNESDIVPTLAKIAFIDALSKTGVHEIEVTSFVSPQWIPQLADASEVLAGIRRAKGVVYSVLVPNEKGLDRALPGQPDQLAIFTAASETFNQKNINTSIEGSFERFTAVMRRAREEELPVRGYVSTAFWCPYEGRIPPERAVEVGARLLDAGCFAVAFGDTIGKATPDEVRAVLDLALKRMRPEQIAMHFHDTFGNAVDNVLTSWRLGIEQFDASAGGLGGCPYAPAATGNVAMESVVRALQGAGAALQYDLAALDKARAVIAPYVAGR